MALASSCSCVLLLILCGYSGVHGDNMDMPNLASILQAHVDGSSHHTDSTWKAQAQMFIGLLQSMGKVVPKEYQNSTKDLTDKILALLRDAEGTLVTDSQSATDNLVSEMKKSNKSVIFYDQEAGQDKTSTKTKNIDLATCYKQLRILQAIYQNGCISTGSLLQQEPGSLIQKEDPVAAKDLMKNVCERVENTKKHNFGVSSKFTWQCNFTNGDTTSSCIKEKSALKSDLKTHLQDMKTKYLQWLDNDADCKAKKKEHKNACNGTKNNITNKADECEAIFVSAEGLLCDRTMNVHKREEAMADLTVQISNAPNLLKEKEVVWTDLQLIICIFERFRKNMTFGHDDYSGCKVDYEFPVAPPSVNPPFAPETEGKDLDFGGGLAARYLDVAPAETQKQVRLRVQLHEGSEPKLLVASPILSPRKVCNGGARAE